MPSVFWPAGLSSGELNHRLEFALRLAEKHLPATPNSPGSRPHAELPVKANPSRDSAWLPPATILPATILPAATDPVIRLVLVDDSGCERRIRIRISAFRGLRRLLAGRFWLWRAPSEAARSVLS